MNDMNLVETQNLTKKYSKGPVAVHNLSLVVPRGKIIGLLGPNGSGKTTLIKMLNGLLTPSGGSVLINGQAPGVETKKRVSYLPEKTYLQNNRKVSDLVDYFGDFYEDFRKERAYEMFRSLNIDLNHSLKTLSKGTQEKVQLILVMSRDADLFILDEPIAGVDPASRDYIMKTIISNYNEKASILLSTHIISDIENVLDEVIFLRDGQVILQSSVENVREKQGKSVDAYFREVFAC
jgi:ABC-2 type transport system ATP-binding protein